MYILIYFYCFFTYNISIKHLHYKGMNVIIVVIIMAQYKDKDLKSMNIVKNNFIYFSEQETNKVIVPTKIRLSAIVYASHIQGAAWKYISTFSRRKILLKGNGDGSKAKEIGASQTGHQLTVEKKVWKKEARKFSGVN